MNTSRVPALQLHRATGRAKARFGNRDIYFGRFGTPEANAAYHAVVAHWLRTGELPASRADIKATVPTVGDLITGYTLARGRAETRTFAAAEKPALDRLARFFGDQPATNFGPLMLKRFRETVLRERSRNGRRLTRQYVNDKIVPTVLRLFRWAAAEERLGSAGPNILKALESVPSLKPGETDAPETEPVRPVSLDVIRATLAHLPPVVGDMVRVQLLTAMRPGEVCAMRWSEIDTSGPVWIFSPRRHKTKHRGRTRAVAIPAPAQAILMRYRARPEHEAMFSPADSEAQRLALARQARRSKVPPSQMDRSVDDPKTRPGDCYRTDGYGQAIRRACESAGIDPWSPNQLRHAAATIARKARGLDAAGALLGHAKADVTQVYAERDQNLAASVAAEIAPAIAAAIA